MPPAIPHKACPRHLSKLRIVPSQRLIFHSGCSTRSRKVRWFIFDGLLSWWVISEMVDSVGQLWGQTFTTTKQGPLAMHQALHSSHSEIWNILSARPYGVSKRHSLHESTNFLGKGQVGNDAYDGSMHVWCHEGHKELVVNCKRPIKHLEKNASCWNSAVSHYISVSYAGLEWFGYRFPWHRAWLVRYQVWRFGEEGGPILNFIKK